uniref:Uncharacterized protein n=1 Tax=Hucho hucho TaxID=62062 RepID=A0A4W5JR14_9TELE
MPSRSTVRTLSVMTTLAAKGEPLPPSFPTDLWFDREEKNGLLYDSLVLINLAACDRHKFAEEDKRRVKERLQQNWSREARCSWNNVMGRKTVWNFVFVEFQCACMISLTM